MLRSVSENIYERRCVGTIHLFHWLYLLWYRSTMYYELLNVMAGTYMILPYQSIAICARIGFNFSNHLIFIERIVSNLIKIGELNCDDKFLVIYLILVIVFDQCALICNK